MSFKPGQKLTCKSTGVTGHFVKQFRATGIGEIVLVRVPDGRLYRAPLSDWAPIIDESQVYGNDCPSGRGMSDERRLCSRCGIFPRKQGEEICESCMELLILGIGNPRNEDAWNRFVEEFSDALIRADCRRKQERSESR